MFLSPVTFLKMPCKTPELKILLPSVVGNTVPYADNDSDTESQVFISYDSRINHVLWLHCFLV